nr:glyoxysomal processing protease, glyoxysomal isoform X2 [Tanacetum cinerariifolium]
MKDLSILKDLDKPNEHLSSVWALMPPVSTKPRPEGDNFKDTKVSRFAKFIAERRHLLKQTSPPDKTDPDTSKVVANLLLQVVSEPGVHIVHDEKRVWFEVELQGVQGDREAEVFQVSNDDTAVAQRRLEDKQPEKKTNTNSLVNEQEKEYQTGWNIKTGTQQQNGLVDETNVTLFANVRCFLIQSVACEVISKWKAGLKDDMDARSDVYVLSNGCRKCSGDIDGYYWSKMKCTWYGDRQRSEWLYSEGVTVQVLQQKVGTNFVGGTLHTIVGG